jgi:S-adenosylmethionine-dependent methyltransferase
VTGFSAGREPWLARQANLRNLVRQELVSRQLAAHLPARPTTVLDVGAGQGTQAIRLARRGFDVLAAEPDPLMRDAFAAAVAEEPPDVRHRLHCAAAGFEDLPDLVGPRGFDVVLCHGVLMYLPEPGPAVVALSDLVAPGGVLSLVARNAAGMALRPGLRRQWADVLDLMDQAEQSVPHYVNELGVRARADRLEELASYVSGRRMHVEAWYGVRVVTDGVGVDEPAPADPDERDALLAAEERLGRTDPYRRVATLLHLIGRRAAT